MVGRVDHQRLVLVAVVDDHSQQDEHDELLVILVVTEHLTHSELAELVVQHLVEVVEVVDEQDSIR